MGRRNPIVAFALLALSTAPALARQPGPSVPMTLLAPQPMSVALSLTELEIDFSDRAAARPMVIPSGRDDARVQSEQDGTAVLSISGVAALDDLRDTARALEAVNPGARANFVIYETRRNGAGERMVLTSRVALIVTDPASRGVVEDYASRNPQPVAGVPGGYTLDAADPLEAIRLADELRSRPGVRTVYPLIKRRSALR
jgi:hypothetical protein